MQFVSKIVVMTIFLLMCCIGYTYAATDCSVCHGTSVATQHHETTYFQTGECSVCHEGVTTNGNCAGCHSFTLEQNKHHVSDVPLDCNTCHVNTIDLAACTTCHTDGIQAPHHAQAAAGVTCVTCHTTMTMPQTEAGNIACESCHDRDPLLRTRHHEKANTLGVGCTMCHTNIQNSIGECSSCHTTGTKRDVHHATANPEFNDCSDCHSMLPPTVTFTDGCNTCHDSNDNLTFHHEVVKVNNSFGCGDCHSGMESVSSCVSCHDTAYFAPVNIHHETSTKDIYGFACLDCHVMGPDPVTGQYVIYPPPDDVCAYCHNSPGLPTISERHHMTQQYIDGDCASCHGSSVSVGQLDCASCHNDTTGTTAENHHARSQDCNLCHTNANTVLVECESCHTTRAGSMPIEQQHHLRAEVSQIDCSVCHVGALTGDMSCENCHLGANLSSLSQRHHDTEQAKMQPCSSCHVGSDDELSCATCHVSQPHHASVAASEGNCNVCHTDLQLKGDECSSCHTTPITEIHHGAPLQASGGNCAACHQSVSTPDVCANCHTGGHHDTTYAQAGNCTHCHKAPPEVADRPKQAACRECHGSNMHDKGGPIQDFGACAACHNTTVFHASPNRPMGYTWMKRSGSQFDTGKGKFNLFWGQFTRNGDEEIMEDHSPNGEDMNDEGGRRFRSPTLEFTMKTITNNGRSYQVPSFDLETTPPDTPDTPDTPPTPSYNVSASDHETGYEPYRAYDGDTSSRWWTRDDGDEWLVIDLGERTSFSSMTIKWHSSNYPRDYEVHISDDKDEWDGIKRQRYFRGGEVRHSFWGEKNARYVRINMKDARNDGYSIYEITFN